MNPAIYLDRDGVIIENRTDYVRDWSQVYIFPQALRGLSLLCQTPFKIIIVTNQSAVGRGLISLDTALDINQRLVEQIEQTGSRIDGVFMCPHSPENGCLCRKPAPGLLLDAAQALSVDLERSYLVGDAVTDLLAGEAAGIRQTVLVKTGRGSNQVELLPARIKNSTRIYATLEDFAIDLIHTTQPGASPITGGKTI